MIENIHTRGALTVTFNTTEECNLACKYCYEINKKNKVLSIENAKKFIDIILDDDDILDRKKSKIKTLNSIYERGITLDFIGGDSLMNVDLLEEIILYWIKQVNTKNTINAKKWKDNYRFTISTNGTLFVNKEVRDFLERYKEVFSIGVSIDGCPDIHDKNRIFKDGTGSMSTILKSWDWFRKTFTRDALVTKSTCSKDSIPYLYDSLVFMHDRMGLQYINQNFIMEDTHCTQEDYEELKRQMQKCIEYVYFHKDDLYWSMIDKAIFAEHKNYRLTDNKEWNKGRCGGGGMPALSIDGFIYPCFRFLPHTMADYESSKSLIVGDVNNGFNHKENFTKTLEGAKRCNCTKDPKCLDCEYESACSYCIGGCYSEFGEFKRTTYICEITKIQCEYAKKYWNRIEMEANNESK